MFNNLTKLKILDLSENKIWLKDNENLSILTEFLSKQQELEELNLSWNNFDDQDAHNILVSLKNSDCVKTMKHLNIMHFPWRKKENCIEFASILANAISLESVNITF